MLSQFSVFPPLSESAQEVLSHVCSASHVHRIVIERRMRAASQISGIALVVMDQYTIR